MSRKLSLEHLLTDDSFIRFLKGISPEEEYEYWENWKFRDPDHQILVEQAKELVQYTAASDENLPDPYAELRKLEASINPSKRTSSIKLSLHKPRATNSWWISIAAILLLTVSTGLFINKSGILEEDNFEEVTDYYESQFQTSYGEKASVYLTDGSRIMLNANSNLKYYYSNSTRSGREIDIHLNGEAWFDIVPTDTDQSRLIRIHTENGIVEVLGTTFTVQTSALGTRAVLEKGNIHISRKGSEYNDGIIMNPGEMAQILPDSGIIELRQVNPELYTSWIKDVWMFDETQLTEIAERIENVFGVEVLIPSTELQHKTLSGSIGSGNLQIIKKGLSEALNIEVIQSDNRIIFQE